MRVAIIVLSILSAAAFAAAAQAVPKATLATQANAICKPVDQKFKTITHSGGDTDRVLAKVIRIEQRQHRQLAALKPDAPQKVLYRAFLANGRKLIGVYRTFRAINHNPDAAAARRATARSMRLNRKLERQAGKLGATACFAGPA